MSRTLVGEVMTAPAVTITPEAAAGQAARLMHRRRVGRLPVISRPDGRLPGILTRSDPLHVYPPPGGQLSDRPLAVRPAAGHGSRPGQAGSSPLR